VCAIDDALVFREVAKTEVAVMLGEGTPPIDGLGG
jgi:hypothetical protein